jgi:hypothetical protein
MTAPYGGELVWSYLLCRRIDRNRLLWLSFRLKGRIVMDGDGIAPFTATPEPDAMVFP